MQQRITQFISYIRGGVERNVEEAGEITDEEAEVARATQL